MGKNPWLYVFLFVFVVMAFVMLVSVLQSALIAAVAGKYADKTQTKYINKMLKHLPRKNCGKCGYPTCAEYADAVLHTQAPENACPWASDDTPEKLEEIRADLQDELEDPTPPKETRKSYWDRKL